jgi:hypothetical protein
MVLTHGIICSSNPQRPRGGSGFGFVSTITAIQTRSVRTPTDRKIFSGAGSRLPNRNTTPKHVTMN